MKANFQRNRPCVYTRECESRSKSCGITITFYFDKRGTHARTHVRTARTCRNGCKKSKETFEEMRLQGRRPSVRSPSVSITGPKQLRGDFPFALRLPSLFFSRIPYYRCDEGGGGERGGQSLTLATRRSSQLPRLFSRARACTQMRDR